MRSLFVKIFLWFWLAMTMVAVTFVLLTVTLDTSSPISRLWQGFLARQSRSEQPPAPSGERFARWFQTTATVLALSGQTAAEIYRRDGVGSYLDYIRRIEQVTHIHLYMFDGVGQELGGQSVPEAVMDVFLAAQTSPLPEFLFEGKWVLLGQRISGTLNQKYVVVGSMGADHVRSLDRDSVFTAARFAAILITAGIVCYWLARHITAPLRKLRSAARRMAQGDLSVRVTTTVGNRRDEIADLSIDFDLMAERIQSLLMGQRRLLRDISHELRSPLARLGIALELARQRAGESAAGALDRIEVESGRLNALIEQLLTLARLESGVDTPEKKPVDLEALLQEVVADAQFEGKSIHRDVSLDLESSCIVMGNRDLLRSAVENVVRNALSYTAEGTCVEVTLLSIRRHMQSTGSVVVRDHGPGVPEDELQKLFEPFYRVSAARDRKTGGRGLGLAIAETVVKLHGGVITASNASDGGLVLTLELPAVSATTSASADCPSGQTLRKRHRALALWREWK